jgi:hypothetical protein
MSGCVCSITYIFIYYDEDSSGITACSEHAWLSITIPNFFVCVHGAYDSTLMGHREKDVGRQRQGELRNMLL